MDASGAVFFKTPAGSWVPRARYVAEAFLERAIPPGHRVVQLAPHEEPCPSNLAVKATGGPVVPLAEVTTLLSATWHPDGHATPGTMEANTLFIATPDSGAGFVLFPPKP